MSYIKTVKIIPFLFRPAMVSCTFIAMVALPMLSSGQNFQCQWAHAAGNAAMTTISGQDVNASGDVYVTGSYLNNNLSFDNSTTLLNPNPDTSVNKLFIAEYNPSGNLLWAKGFESGGYALSSAITVDNQGNLYLTGYFYDSITFGSLTLTQNPGSLNEAAFIAKFDSSGQVLWAKQTSILSAHYKVNNDGHIAFYGAFSDPSVTLGNNLTLTNSDSSGQTTDFFIAELNQNGNFLWAKSGGVSGKSEEIYSVAFTQDNQIYVSGLFESTLTLDGITLNSIGNTSWAAKDWFLARYDTIGNVPWAIRGGISLLAPLQLKDGPLEIKTDQYDNLYFLGSFHNSTMQVDSLTLNGMGTLSGSIMDNTVDEYWFAGMCNEKEGLVWAKSGNSPVQHIHFMPAHNGVLYLAGLFRDTAIFGNITLTGTSSGGQNYEGFVVKLGALGQVAWAKQFGPFLNIYANLDMAVDQYNTLNILGVYGDSHGIIPNLTMHFDSLSLTSINSTRDYFLTRYKDNGAVLSASDIGSPGVDGLTSGQLNLVGQSGLYVSGGYSAAPLTLDTITVNFPDPNLNNYFIAKYVDTNSTTGLNNVRLLNTIQVFPNPSTGVVHISAPSGISKISVVTALGREVYYQTLTVPQKKYILNLGSLSNGIYWLKIENKEGFAIKKIVFSK